MLRIVSSAHFFVLLQRAANRLPKFRAFLMPVDARRLSDDDNKIFVHRLPVWVRRTDGSGYGPWLCDVLIHEMLTGEPCHNTKVCTQYGVPWSFALRVSDAAADRPGHCPKLRRRILRAFELDEVPHTRRKRFAKRFG